MLVNTCTWGTVTVISFVSPTTSSAGLVVSTEAGLKSSAIEVHKFELFASNLIHREQKLLVPVFFPQKTGCLITANQKYVGSGNNTEFFCTALSTPPKYKQMKPEMVDCDKIASKNR